MDNRKRGLVLAEAMVAIAILVLSVSIVGRIYQQSVNARLISRDYLIAENLATEAIEAVKNIRDTNWLKTPSKSQCWLTFDSDLNCGNLATKPSYQMIKGYNYIINQKDSGIFQLIRIYNSGLNLAADNSTNHSASSQYRLNLKDIGDGYKQYVSTNSSEPTNFYRQVKIIDIKGFEQVTVEAKVEWLEGAKVRRAVRQVVLYNYL